MENKWKYNAGKREVVEQPTMGKPSFYDPKDKSELRDLRQKRWDEYKAHLTSRRSIPVSGKVDWKDGEEKIEDIDFEIDFYLDVVGKRIYEAYPLKQMNAVTREVKQEQPQHTQLQSKVSGWMEKAEARIEIRKYAREMFDKYAIYKDNPIAWSIWKIAFSVALNPQFTFPENQSQPILQDNVIEDEDTSELCEEGQMLMLRLLPSDSYGEDPDAERLYEILGIISRMHDRITSLETDNAFHKKEAEDAVLEQHRLIKENTTLLEVIQEQERAKDILINRIEGLRNGIK